MGPLLPTDRPGLGSGIQATSADPQPTPTPNPGTISTIFTITAGQQATITPVGTSGTEIEFEASLDLITWNWLGPVSRSPRLVVRPIRSRQRRPPTTGLFPCDGDEEQPGPWCRVTRADTDADSGAGRCSHHLHDQLGAEHVDRDSGHARNFCPIRELARQRSVDRPWHGGR